MPSRFHVFLLFASLAAGLGSGFASPAVARQEMPRVESLLVVEPVSRGGRSPVFTDAIEARRVDGSLEAPREGDTLTAPDGATRTWRRLTPAEDGSFRDRALRGGYAFATLESGRDRVVLLDASGHRHLYVNGAPRGGDLYDLGLMRIPIRLRKGANALWFKAGRGRLQIALEEPPAPVFLESKDRVTPDVITGESETIFLGIPVTNATTTAAVGYTIEARWTGAESTAASRAAVPAMPPLTTRRVPVGVAPPSNDDAALNLELELAILDGGGNVVHRDALSLERRAPHERHRRTFVSEIDGSVQFFAVMPPPAPIESPALYLTLHGAGVVATNQAYSYAPKEDGWVVAPTNRRRFGFDWEDWGRLDALEVLAEAEARFGTDPSRTYLTGHSMGGHGTWNLGAHFPDRFAAIAPSAGWRDFASYGGAVTWESPTPIQSLLLRAANASRTLLLERNWLHGGVYVLHGDADRTVPVEQARFLRKRLAEFHPNFAYYERPGAGHWWGNACMDWPPLFDFLRQNRRPEDHDVLTIEFATVNPGISAGCHWLTIEESESWMEPARVDVRLDPEGRSLELRAADNVARVSFDLRTFAKPRTRLRDGESEDATLLPAGEPVRVVLGERTMEVDWPSDGIVRLARSADGRLVPSGPADPNRKGPHRAGPFKDAFRHRMMFVYATGGDDEENRLAFEKARFDAETFHYRGNGSVDLVADVDFDPAAHPDRSVVLYGNAETCRAWSALLADSPIRVTRGAARVGDVVLEGDDSVGLFVRPRPGSDRAYVAAVASTGPGGSRLATHLPYFVSGVGYPDWCVIDRSMLTGGSDGVVAAGFFGGDWSLENGESAWRDAR